MNGPPRVAIIGIGCICAPGRNLRECMDTLFAGGIKPLPPRGFHHGHSISYPVFEVAEDWIAPGSGTAGTSRTNRLVLAASIEAMNNAELDREILRSPRVGVCVGTTVGSAMNDEVFYRRYSEGEQPDMAPITGFLNGNPAGAVARQFGLAGPCQTIVNACSSGTDAIGVGALWIRSGLCDIVLAGGADELCHVSYNGFVSLMITDSSFCRPFDLHRRGLNLGEGAAMLVLQAAPLRHGAARRPRAFVLGYGASCDAHHLTAPHPDGQGLRRAIGEALRTSGVSPHDISFVNAHGTGTKDNDRVESIVLSDMLPEVPFLSTKGCTGHTLGAAGAIEAAFTVACLEEGRIPQSIGFESPDPDLPASPVRCTTTLRGTVALSESLAFGGHNAALVLSVEEGAS